jgi:hypothetical protein
VKLDSPKEQEVDSKTHEEERKEQPIDENEKEKLEEELADIEAAEKTHEIRSKDQKYRTLSRKKSSEVSPRPFHFR